MSKMSFMIKSTFMINRIKSTLMDKYCLLLIIQKLYNSYPKVIQKKNHITAVHPCATSMYPSLRYNHVQHGSVTCLMSNIQYYITIHITGLSRNKKLYQWYYHWCNLFYRCLYIGVYVNCGGINILLRGICGGVFHD